MKPTFAASLARFATLAAAAALAPAALAQGPAPIATQGTASVTLQDVDARAATIPEDKRAGFFDSPKRIESLVTGILLNRQLANEAVEAGLDKSAEAQRQIQLAREDVLARLRMEAIKKDTKVDALVIARERYQVDPSAYATPEQRVVRHILFDTSGGDLTAKSKLAKAEAALAKGDAFADVAMRFSDDETSAKSGGLLPKFGPGLMQKPFEEAVYALQKPGDRSPVVRTSYGYHLIELVSIEPRKARSFEEVRDEVVKQVETEQVNRAAQEHIDRLRNKPLEADQQAIASLRTRYAPKDAAGNPILPSGAPVEGDETPATETPAIPAPAETPDTRR